MKFSLIDVVKTVIAQEVTHDPIVGWLDASQNYLDLSGLHSTTSINLNSLTSAKSNENENDQSI